MLSSFVNIQANNPSIANQSLIRSQLQPQRPQLILPLRPVEREAREDVEDAPATLAPPRRLPRNLILRWRITSMLAQHQQRPHLPLLLVAMRQWRMRSCEQIDGPKISSNWSRKGG